MLILGVRAHSKDLGRQLDGEAMGILGLGGLASRVLEGGPDKVLAGSRKQGAVTVSRRTWSGNSGPDRVRETWPRWADGMVYL